MKNGKTQRQSSRRRIAGRLALVALVFACLNGRADDFATYERCLDDLKLTREHYQSKLPPGSFAWDRKLLHMSQGIEFIESNFTTLRNQVSTSNVTPAQRHTLRNAVEACQNYLAVFELRAQRFVVFVGCLALLAGALTLWLLFIMVPRKSRKDVNNVAPKKEPAERMGKGHPTPDDSPRVSSKRR